MTKKTDEPKVATPEVRVARLANETQAMLTAAQEYTIATPAEYVGGGEGLKIIKAKTQELDALRKGMTQPLDEAKRRILALFKAPQERLQEAESAIKGALLAYSEKQEAKRAEEEARLREQARKEEERLRARAEKAAAAGHEEKAEALEEQAENVMVPIVSSPQPKVSGVTTRITWKAEVTDKAALIKAVAAGEVPDVALEPNMTFLNQQARSLKDVLSYPGVQAVSEKTVAAGSGDDPGAMTPRS